MNVFHPNHSSSEHIEAEKPNTNSKWRHRKLPWIEDPTKCMEAGKKIVFYQRHAANTIELFFDLFFVANLTTFTTYHAILDLRTLAGYIGFFAFIWSTWFQITLHDVRFSRDSLYERTCKVIQMIIFASFALVGSKFQPGSSEEGSNAVRIFSYFLLIHHRAGHSHSSRYVTLGRPSWLLSDLLTSC
jgi:hypothetical protein